MQRAKTPAAQEPPRRNPLQELKLQSGADRTSLTPLFRRLRLKDHDCATPVSYALGPRNSITAVPCSPGPPRSATLRPPSTSMTSTRGLRTLVLKPDASEAPSNATLIPGALETSSSTSPEASGSSISVSSTPELPDNTVPAPLCSPVPVPSTSEPSSTTMPTSVCSSIPVPSTPEPASSTMPTSVCSSIPEPSSGTVPVPLWSSIPAVSTPKPSSSTMPVSLCSTIPVVGTLESPGSITSSLVLGPCTLQSRGSPTLGLPNIISSVSCNPNSPGSSALPPCSSGSPGNASTASCTPGPPGTSSTPQKAPFHGWRAAPPDFSRSLLASEPPSANGSADPLNCQGTPEGAKFPAPVPPEQSPPGLPPIKASGLEPAGSEATLTPVTLPESTLAVSWMLPLVWLEKTLNSSFLEESLSLPLCKLQQDTSSSVTPVPTVATGTSITPVSTTATGTSITPVSTVTTGTSITPVSTTAMGTSITPVSTMATGTSITPVPTTAMGTSITPVPTTATGTSITPVPTAVAGTNMTPVPTRAFGTSMTPVPTMATGTSITPVSTMATGTSITPVPTAVAGTNMTPVPTRAFGTSMTPVPTMATGTSITPVSTMATGTSITPVSTMATGTFMTPRDVWERSMNTSRGSVPCAKDSAVQTDSLLWHCPREQLKTLPRAELEERLESTLIIIEVLSLQLRDWQESQRLRLGMGPAEQRHAYTQTDTIHSEGSTWSSQSLLFRNLADAASQSLQDEQREQERTLVSQAVLESAPSKVQSCLEEQDAIRQLVDEAKDQEYLFLKAFFAHASAEISARDQSLASQQELSTLLAHAINLQASLSAKRQSFWQFIDVTFENMEKERRVLDEEREQMRALTFQSCAMLKGVPGKVRSCLEELAVTRERAEEALQAKEEVSCQLEKTLATLQDREAQLQQLTVANSRLGKELSSVMIKLASTEQERDALQQENEKQGQEMGQLAQEKNSLQQECKQLCQELREATECREFLDQENKMCRMQLQEVEARLNSTLATLQELMETHQRQWEEKAALSKELDSTKAELLSLQTKRNKVYWCSTDIMESKMQLQELVDGLKAALEEQDDCDAPSRSKAWTPGPRTPGWQTPRRARTPACRTPACHTPHHASSSFVGSVLRAAAGKDHEDTLLESVQELRAVVSNLAMLSTCIQELEQSKFRALQTEISDLQLRLETLTAESQEKLDTQAATIAKLKQALRTKLENEKELQDVVKQQEEKMLQLIDKSGEVTRLKAEVSHLKCLLQRAETEAKVLWEEMRDKEHQVDTAYVQERVMLRQEVDKLTLMLVEKENENIRLTNKYLEQIQGLEMKLHRTQKVLRTYEEMQENKKEVLPTVPAVPGLPGAPEPAAQPGPEASQQGSC